MTFKEEFEKKKPGEFNLMRCPRDKKMDMQDCGNLTCIECWNREIPKEETKEEKQTIKDSGERRKFETGAVRDMAEGKGRFDLMPVDVLYMIFSNNVLKNIALYQKENDVSQLLQILSCNLASSKFILTEKIAKHFENGAKKYEENNWKKGIPCKCFVDSALRHFFKFIANHKDEDHEAAFYWNIMCCIWTHENIPEMQSYKRGD